MNLSKILNRLLDIFIKKEPQKIMQNAYRTQGFGEHPEWYNEYDLAGHEGIDYSTKRDRTIYNPERGIVERDYDIPRGAYGNYVVISYPESGLMVYYAHMKENYVEPGDIVEAGDIIGIMGGTGNSKGDHLHISGKRVNSLGKVLDTDNGYKGYIDLEKEWIIPNGYI